MNEKFILEINPLTKEKKKIDLLDYELTPDFTVRDLIEEHALMKKHLLSQNQAIVKLIEVVNNITKSTAVQIADIKEEIK